jgi:hypothetical protein
MTLSSLYLSVAAIFLCGTFLNAQDASSPCTNKSIEGSYGFQITGKSLKAGDVALTGRLVADGKGAFSGSTWESVNGQIDTAPFTGTYSIQVNCTGTSTVTFTANGLKAYLALVIADYGNFIYLIDIGGGNIESGSAKRQFTRRPER